MSPFSMRAITVSQGQVLKWLSGEAFKVDFLLCFLVMAIQTELFQHGACVILSLRGASENGDAKGEYHPH